MVRLINEYEPDASPDYLIHHRFDFNVNALAYSCNDYFAHVGERLSNGVFDATLAAFGFGARTGVRARESQGILPRGKWRVREALGESGRLLVTPIQMIRAYTALATGGRLYRPQLPQTRNDVASRATVFSLKRNVPLNRRAMPVPCGFRK